MTVSDGGYGGSINATHLWLTSEAYPQDLRRRYLGRDIGSRPEIRAAIETVQQRAANRVRLECARVVSLSHFVCLVSHLA